MEILKFPHPSLFTACAPVTVFGPELKVLLESMWTTMKKTPGIGLAANQVGLSFRMFVMESPSAKKLFIVNPVITDLSLTPANLKEGCLSAPGDTLLVPTRVNWVKIKYQNENGEELENVFFGIHAVCVQHEIDHLDGKAFILAPGVSSKQRKYLSKKWGIKK